MAEATSKDELFCRLAIRQGFLAKAHAIAALKAYRSEGKVSQGIGKFLVQRQLLSPEEVQSLEGAIARRAEGHVVDTRRRVPRTRGAGGGPVHHRERVHYRAEKVAASPAQLTVVTLGAIVLIGCVLAIIFKMNEGGAPVDSITDPGTTQKPAAASRTTNAADVHPALAKPPAEMPKPQFSESELRSFRNAADRAVTSARQMQGDGRVHSAVLHLNKVRKELSDNFVPDDILAVIDTETVEMKETLRLTYEEHLAELMDLKKEGKDAEVQDLLSKIELTCGPERRKQAETAIQ